MTTALAHAPALLTTLHAQAFARDGYLLLRNLLPAARLEAVRSAIDARVAAIRTELISEGIALPPPATDFRGHKQFNLRPKLPGQELTTVAERRQSNGGN